MVVCAVAAPGADKVRDNANIYSSRLAVVSTLQYLRYFCVLFRQLNVRFETVPCFLFVRFDVGFYTEHGDVTSKVLSNGDKTPTRGGVVFPDRAPNGRCLTAR